MTAHTRRCIGGDFELPSPAAEVTRAGDFLARFKSGTWTASGRAALGLILRVLRDRGVRGLHVPSFVCQSLLLPAQKLGFDCTFYPVAEDLRALPDPPQAAAVLLVHYFGWPNPAAPELRLRAGKEFELVEDMSHGMLGEWEVPSRPGHYVFFSARKFGPHTCGGWCNVGATRPDVEESGEAAIDDLAERGARARRMRGAYLADPAGRPERRIESSYLAELAAVEQVLDEHPLAWRLPAGGWDLLAGTDWGTIAARRRENWLDLSRQLAGRVERQHRSLPDGVSPLGFVVRLTDREGVRRRLSERRMFCPVHWPLPAEVPADVRTQAQDLSDHCLTLPIDQRYGSKEMSLLAAAFVEALENNAD